MANITLKQHIPIFVSSTYEDMKSYRNAVEDIITKLEHVVKGMELFGSSPAAPKEKCYEEVRKSKLFICILGMRYGSIEEAEKISFTQLEYDEAIRNKIPVLVYIMDEDFPVPPKFVDKGEGAEMLESFKQQLSRKHVVSKFGSPADLAAKVSADIIKTLENMEGVILEENNDFSNTSKGVELIKRFYERSKMMDGFRMQLIIQLNTKLDYSDNYEDFSKQCGLEMGDCASFLPIVFDTQGNKFTDRSLYFYVTGDVLDEIEKYGEGDKLLVDVELKFVQYKYISDVDGKNASRSKSTRVALLRNINKKVE